MNTTLRQSLLQTYIPTLDSGPVYHGKDILDIDESNIENLERDQYNDFELQEIDQADYEQPLTTFHFMPCHAMPGRAAMTSAAPSAVPPKFVPRRTSSRKKTASRRLLDSMESQ